MYDILKLIFKSYLLDLKRIEYSIFNDTVLDMMVSRLASDTRHHYCGDNGDI